jgi:phosphoglycolate phosphatase-like HAD superfamily hydrolase
VVRLVLFDIDGTLIRTGGAGVRAFAKVFETEFQAKDGFERLKFAGRTDRSLVREFFSLHGIPASEENFERFVERYVFWLDHLLHTSRAEVCPGVIPLLDGLKALPNPPVLGLLTGNIRLGAEIKLRYLKLWDYFETGGFADDHEDRNFIAKAARQRGCRLLRQEIAPEDVVVVGDTPFDITCGRSIGARVLAVATGGAALGDLQTHKPDWLLKDLTQIAPHDLIYPGAGASN